METNVQKTPMTKDNKLPEGDTADWRGKLFEIFEENSERYEFVVDKVVSLIEQTISKALEKQRDEITAMLDKWTDFTCHSREEHEKNDCPGWSHEDQMTRATVLSQVKASIERLGK